MSEKLHSYKFLVKEAHLDTFGHVNNATYLMLLEEARWDWITRNGYGLDKIKACGLGPVILEINIAFKRELTLRQEINIETYLLEHKGKVSYIRQEMLTNSGLLCCRADFTFGLFDTKLRKLVPATVEWTNALKPLT